MKEIETLVEEKKKDSSEMAMIIAPQEGEYYTRMTREPVMSGRRWSICSSLCAHI